MVSIPSMGYTHAEAYCNRLANFMHMGRLEKEGRLIHKLAESLKDEDAETKARVFKNFLEGLQIISSNDQGVRFEFYFAVIGRIFTPVARDQAAKMAVENDCDYLFMIDDDMICPDDMFQKLYAHDKDIVAALAFTRNYPHRPVMYSALEGYDPVARKEYFKNHVIQNYPKGELVECDAVGFGAVLIKTWTLHKMEKPWFMSTCGTGEDILFCYKAKKIGARVFMDTACSIGHLGAPINVDEDYVEKMKAKEMPDFNKIHPVYDKYKENGKEAVFVTGDYV
jgi:hypothetical protein